VHGQRRTKLEASWSRMKEFLICIPTYNEANDIEPLVERILRLELNADILIIDDNSPDGTGRIVDELAAQHPGIKVMHRAGKNGIGSAHLDGIHYAYKTGYRILVTMDADFSHMPEDIARLLEHGTTFDVVVGTRFECPESLKDWNWFRKTLTQTGHYLTKTLLRLPYDATSALRLYRLDRIGEEYFRVVASVNYAFFFESLTVLYRNGFRIAEVPINLPARVYGHSKMQVRHMIGGLLRLGKLAITLTVARNWLKRARPQPASFDPTQAQQEWDAYWGAKKSKPSEKAIYDVIARFYRNYIIKPNLNRHIRQSFAFGASVLHAGCGGGEVDVDVIDYVKVTALEISPKALDRYRVLHGNKCSYMLGSIMDTGFREASFDGVYNLGVMEHFEQDDIEKILRELHRVLKAGGKVVLFWPPVYGLSVMALHVIHFILNRILRKNIRLHPDEPTKVTTPKQVSAWLDRSGLKLESFSFGIRDLFTYAVIVASKPT